MKIKGKKEALLEGIQSAQITSPKTTLPILSNILMSAEEENELTVIATDLELSIKTKFEIEVLEKGSICVPLKKLIEIIRELVDKEDVLIEVEENNRVVISSKDSIFHLFGLPKEDFPLFPEYSQEKSFNLSSTLLKEMIRKTIFATAMDEIRYVLNGVFFIVKENECRMVATDGHRLAVIKKTLPGTIGEEQEIIVPTKALTEVNRIIPEEQNVQISIDKNKIVFQINNLIIVSRLIEGKFPDYKKVIPQDQDKTLKINTQQLISTSRRVSLMTTDFLKFNICKNKLKLFSTSELGDAKEELDVNFSGGDIEICFNPKYLMDILKNIEDEEIVILLKTPSTAGIVQPLEEKEGEEYLCVLMPVRT
ncbi:MAG: DNA polymerase III subunit beta [bacterium]